MLGARYRLGRRSHFGACPRAPFSNAFGSSGRVERLRKIVIIATAHLWNFVLDVGVARRRASIYLALYSEVDWEDEFAEERQSLLQYLSALVETVEASLAALGIPSPCIRRILDCYGAVDTGDFPLPELQQARTELFSRRTSLPLVD